MEKLGCSIIILSHLPLIVFGATMAIQNPSIYQQNGTQDITPSMQFARAQFGGLTSTILYNSDGLYNVDVRGMACTCNLQLSNTERRADYQYSPGIGVHKLHTRGATFNEARKICIEEGGYLAIINSLDEQQVLLDMFKHSAPFQSISYDSGAYIGIHDYFEDGDWITLFGEPIYKNGYVQWADGQPDNAGGAQKCAILAKPENTNGIDDVTCTDRFAFFCEIPEIRIIT